MGNSISGMRLPKQLPEPPKAVIVNAVEKTQMHLFNCANYKTGLQWETGFSFCPHFENRVHKKSQTHTKKSFVYL